MQERWIRVAVLWTVVDLATKAIAAALGDGIPLLEPSTNPELALGLLGGDDHPALLIGVFAGLVGVLAHGYVLRRRPSGQLGYGLLVGGVAGNGIDRLVTGAVHDWLDLGVVIANVADFVLVAGLGWYVVAAWRSADEPNPARPTT
ncbi:MAG: signal peptidase II [Actinomycetota bacterium]